MKLFTRASVRYWERRRLFYNLTLILPAALSYLLFAGVARVGDADEVSFPYYAPALFLATAFGANVCYSIGYVLEFFLGSRPSWISGGRSTVFALGLVFSVLVALVAGRNIALLEYQFVVEHSRLMHGSRGAR